MSCNFHIPPLQTKFIGGQYAEIHWIVRVCNFNKGCASPQADDGKFSPRGIVVVYPVPAPNIVEGVVVIETGGEGYVEFVDVKHGEEVDVAAGVACGESRGAGGGSGARFVFDVVAAAGVGGGRLVGGEEARFIFDAN